MKSIIEESITWLWTNKPAVAFTAVLIACTIWVTTTVNNFEYRIATTENLVADINNRQLPEIRADIKDIRKEMDEGFQKIDERLDKIELQLNTVLTYLATKK